MYSMTIILWRTTSNQKYEEEEAEAIAKSKKTRYFKGYKQYYYGDEVLTIPSKGRALRNGREPITFKTNNKQLAEFFSKINGKFLEKEKQLSDKYGRPDTSEDFDYMYLLWSNFRQYALDLKKKQKINI